MKIFLFALMLLIGVVLSLHLSMNAQVGAIIKNPKVANAVFWVIGALTAVCVGLVSFEPEALSRTREVPWWLLTAGAIGALLVFGIAWTMPQIGAGAAFVLMIAGQVITGMLMSHYGLLGSPVQPVTLTKLAGVALLLAGVAVFVYSK
ncbi:transporter family-2 protein [Dyadobacter sp. SG02]|uniref:DMT family transporter n=1 Tax=Dyadobacter sp. SG02 TaxID=1855291 RepID=UPI0008C6E257|nr:DMT family transporter [Dyadobacter sp. SG02]SEI52476.1 transporter family-2 protein [Dyadobacter sp. SG02]